MMQFDSEFDVIVAGGGLAGLAAAYHLAQAGAEVLVIERGDYAGAKNVTGGRLYLGPVWKLFPGKFWEKAPLERRVAHEEISIMDGSRALTLRFGDYDPAGAVPHSATLLRAKFDRYFAKQAERNGAVLVTKTKVDELLVADGRVCGVRAGGEALGAKVVIVCDGILSLLARNAGFGKKPDAGSYAVGVKEIIEMEPSLIEERFRLTQQEGSARLFLGDITAGNFGGGFLYTNRESISLGLVLGITGYQGDSLPDLLDRFKARPEVARLIGGGNSVEYSAHVISESGYDGSFPLFGNGILLAGDAADFNLNLGLTVRGMEYALASGCLAAEAVLQARQKGDFSAGGLACYDRLLQDSFVLQDFRRFKDAPHALETERLYREYPHLACEMASDLFRIPDGPKERLNATVKKHLRPNVVWNLCRDYVGRLRKI